MKKIKCVLVGDNDVGKTSLIITYTSGTFPSGHVPSVHPEYSIQMVVADESVNLELWDTKEEEYEDEYRLQTYPHTDVFLLCFSVESQQSFENVKSKWLPELTHHSPGVPIVLVGNKSDLQDDEQTRLRLEGMDSSFVTKEKALQMATEVGAVQYVECSAKTQERVTDVFDEAICAFCDSVIEISLGILS